MNNRKLYIIFFSFLLISAFCPAQEGGERLWDGFLKVASFGKPFWSDMYSTSNWIEVSYATNSPYYDWGEFDTDYRFFLFANIGVDTPLWSGDFSEGKYGLSVTMPYMIELWYDRFEYITTPIIDTAYRFGVFDTSFIYRLDNPKHVFPSFDIYNWTVKLSLFKHESTHLGDELTIFLENHDFPITRVEVLRTYGEIIFTLNDPDSQPRLNHGFRFGFLFNYEYFKDNWYRVMEGEGNPDLAEPSKIPFEFYLQYQYQSPLFSRGFQIIASGEYRLRERHKYPFYYSGSMKGSYQDNPPDLVNCFNVYAGIRYDTKRRDYFSKIGIGARYYFGLNPYGQFRSMPYYRQVGIMAIFE